MSEEIQPKAFDLRIMSRLFLLGSRYWLVLVLALAALAAATYAELTLPLLLKDTIDKVLMPGLSVFPTLSAESAAQQIWDPLFYNVLKYLGLLLLTMVGGFLQVYLLASVSQKVMASLRQDLFNHFLRQSQSWMQNQQVGKLVSGLTSDVGTISDFFNTLFTGLLRDVVVMIGVIFVLFQVNTALAGITLVTLPPVFILISLYRARSRSAYRKVRSAISRLNSFLSERLSGMSIVQLFVQEDRVKDEFREENKNALHASLGEMYVNATFRPIIDLLFSVSLGVLLWFGTGWALAGTLTVGVLIAYVNLLRMFYQPVGDFAENFGIIQSAMAGSERVFKFLDTDASILSKGSLPFPQKAVGVAFEDVQFSYLEGEPVLRGLSFKVEPGQTAAIVGYTGAGKTTITHLLSRFWDVQGGTISVDGVPIENYDLKELRQGVQGVLQDVQLFSGTLRENVTLGRDISQMELDTAAAQSRLDRVLTKQEKGWETELTENGANLSAGERQLVSFARVLVQNPPLLILDEATANIDTQTEHWIQEALTHLLVDRTSIVIAHRLSTIRNADIIFVLDQGKILEQGSHEFLMEQRGFYYNLYKLQYENRGGQLVMILPGPTGETV